MITIAQCLARYKELEPMSDSARLDTEILLAKAIDKPRTFLYTWADKQLSVSEEDQFNRWFKQRLVGEPIAFIIGEKEFWSLTLKVNDSTLIPRPDTELLVGTVLALLPASPQSILDLGTGSGAIALALASERPEWKIMAVDNSVAAVQLAIENCRAFRLTNVEITRSNWYDNVGNIPFDAIVCNPPYIDEADHHLQNGDVRFEPSTALIAKDKGLADIATVIENSHNFLKADGLLMIEHGWQQGKLVRDLFSTFGFVDVQTKQDLAGNDRATLGRTININ